MNECKLVDFCFKTFCIMAIIAPFIIMCIKPIIEEKMLKERVKFCKDRYGVDFEYKGQDLGVDRTGKRIINNFCQNSKTGVTFMF